MQPERLHGVFFWGFLTGGRSWKVCPCAARGGMRRRRHQRQAGAGPGHLIVGFSGALQRSGAGESEKEAVSAEICGPGTGPAVCGNVLARLFGVPERIRTSDLPLRRGPRYPAVPPGRDEIGSRIIKATRRTCCGQIYTISRGGRGSARPQQFIPRRIDLGRQIIVAAAIRVEFLHQPLVGLNDVFAAGARAEA
jgi:hypothetical protein